MHIDYYFAVVSPWVYLAGDRLERMAAARGRSMTLLPVPTALLALPFGILITAVYVLATDRVVYRFYRKQRAASIIVVIASTGVMFVTNGLVRMIIGTDEKNFADGARFLLDPKSFKDWTGLAEPLAIKTTAAVTVIVAAICVALNCEKPVVSVGMLATESRKA